MSEEQKQNMSLAGQKVKSQGLVSEDDNVLNPENKDYMNLSAKEKRLIEKEKLASMGIKGKLQYIWMYYKLHMLGILLLIGAGFVGYDLYENSKYYDILLLEVVDSANGVSESVSDEIKELVGEDDEYARVSVSTNLITDETGEAFQYNAQMAYVTRIANQDIDVIVLPESLYLNMKKEDVFADLSNVLEEETYASFGESIDSTHIEVTDKEFCEKVGILYEPACVCVMVNAVHIETINDWFACLDFAA